jgi:endo-1,4-beta-mannosidase
MRFSLGINYWPRRSAMGMWRRFDPGEIRDDFARIAELGLDAVRFFLRWDDFQPQPDAIDAAMLARLEALVDIAAAAGLRTMPTLFCGHMSGVNWLPDWTLDAGTPHGRFRTIAGDRESPYGIGDFYTGALLDAQLLFARTVGERLRAHPAVVAWDLGNEFSNLREPATEHDAAGWSRRLTAALQESSGIPVTAGTHGEDLTRDRNLRLSSLCAPFAFATMHGYPMYSGFSRSRRDPEVVPFLALLTSAFSHKPVLFSEFGNPTCPPGKFSPFERVALPDELPNPTIFVEDPVFATYSCLSEDEMAAYCTDVLERLHADGRLGAYWWCWADYADELRDEPPFDRAPHELSFGIVRSDGSAKPVASALAAFASQRRSVLTPSDMPLIAEVYFYRTLPQSTLTLYDSFIGSVEERRAGAR